MGHDRIIGGVLYPSVTGLTGMMPKPWLPHWHAAEERKGVLGLLQAALPFNEWTPELKAYFEKERCSDLKCNCEAAKKKRSGGDSGTNFHAAVHAYLLKEKIPELNGGEAKAFRRFMVWAKRHSIEPIMQAGRPMFELHVVHTIWKYVGTLDGLCLIDGIFTLVDWKTSNSMDQAFKIQVPLYGGAALHEGLISEWPRGLILRCDKRDKPYGKAVEEEWLTPEEMRANFEVGVSLRRPYGFALRNGMFRVGA